MKVHEQDRYIFDIVWMHFEGNLTKTIVWFATANPMLGSLSPINMIRIGKRDKLEKWIKTQIEENNEGKDFWNTVKK
jgi:hypothetical protein